MREPDSSLLRRCRQGDAEAFAKLVIAQQDYVYTLARRLLRDPEEAADLTQEVFVQLWRALPSFREQSRFRTWLYRIVVNKCLNRLRKLGREAQTIGLSQEAVDRLPAEGVDPYTEVWRKERRDLIWGQVDNLAPRYRLVLTLFYQHELSCAEIGEVLGLPIGTVKTHLYRARLALAQTLPQGGTDVL
jgi:RNA polymerase sigma-70 factor (ECF subfamily)